MKKILLRLLLPSASTIAAIIAESVAQFINKSGKKDEIEAAMDKAELAVDIQQRIAKWLKDGTMDETETKELEDALLPLCEKLVEKIKKDL